jgi:uncharacterized membrane protein
MKTWHASLLLIPALVFLGCETKSTPGGPGAASGSKTRSTATTHPSGEVSRTTRTEESKHSDDTFTLKGPLTATTLKQGEKKEIDVSISRGKEFKQDVKLKYTAPEGLKVTGPPEIKPSENAAKVMVEVTKGAALGDHEIEITGTPETGKPTTLMVKVTVK